MKKTMMALAAMTLIAAATNASALTVNYVDGVVQNTTGLTGYSTDAQDMLGMTLAITWGNGTVDNYVWSDLGSGASGVDFGAGVIRVTGDTWDASWNLATDRRQIDNIFIDAGAGDAVFDVWTGDFGTVGSANGWAFDPTYGSGFDITATYSGAVGLNGAAPVGDLYRYLNIDFTGDSFRSGDYLTFRADTDSLAISGDINPVPEPSTILLMGLGLAGLVGCNRKRFSKKN